MTPGQVLLIGDRGLAAAEAITRARQWPVVRLDAFEAVAAHITSMPAAPTLVVAPLDALSARTMVALARTLALDAPDTPLGYVYGRTADQLVTSATAILRQESAANEAPDAPIRAFNMLASRYPLRAARLVDVNQQHEDWDRLVDAFRQPSALDMWIGHSNGCDMGLGRTLLCRHDSAPTAPGDELRVMPCYHGGICSREAARKGRATSADRAGARRVIAACCWGVNMANGLFAPEYSIGEGLLIHAGVSTLLASVRAASFETPELALLYHASAAGVPLALVASLANRWRLRSALEAEWVCFGDPHAALANTTEIVEVDVSADPSAGYTVRIGDRTDRRDIVAALPSEGMPDEPIALVLDGPDGIDGVMSTDGRMFLTVEGASDWAVQVRVLDRRELGRATDVASELRADLDFLDVYFLGPLGDMHPRLVSAAAEALTTVRRTLFGWTVGSLPIGTVIRQEAVACEIARLQDTLTILAGRVIDLAAAYTRGAGCMQARLWVWAYDPIASEEQPESCSHCGTAVTASRLTRKTGSGQRMIAFCDSCGFLFEGAVIGAWLNAPRTIRPNEPYTLRVLLRNPARFSMPVMAVAAFDRHETNGSVLVQEDLGSLSAGEAREFAFTLAIPGDAVAGVHYVGLTAMVGARLVCYQRPVFIETSGHCR